LPPAPPASPRALHGDAASFETLLCTVARDVDQARSTAAHSSTARDACRRVTIADVHAYRSAHPADLERLENRMASVLGGLHAAHADQYVELYVALLMQGIDLAHESAGALACGDAGAVTARFSAVVRQALAAHDERQARTRVPVWGWAVLGLLAVILLVVSVGLVSLLVARRWPARSA